jgi:hypothetical protein
MLHRVVWKIITDVSDEPSAFTFRVEESVMNYQSTSRYIPETQNSFRFIGVRLCEKGEIWKKKKTF